MSEDRVRKMLATLTSGDFYESGRPGKPPELRAQHAELRAEIEKQILAACELGQAWAEAEAALPEGWAIADLSHLLAPGQADAECWEAEANRTAFGRWTGEDVAAKGPTPAAALRALAAKLRGEA